MTSPDETPQIPAPRGNRSRYLFLVGAILFAIVIWQVGWEKVSQALFSLDPRYFGAVVALMIGAAWFRAVKWRIVLGKGQNAAALLFLSKAVGNWTPGRVGELSPLLMRNHRKPRLAAWIVTNRLVEISTTLGLGLVGVLAFQFVNTLWAVLIVAALWAFLAAVFYGFTRRHLFERLAEHTPEGSRRRRFVNFLAECSTEMLLFQRLLPLIVAMTLGASLIDLTASVLLFHAFGFSVSFMLIAAVKCASALLAAIPVTADATGAPLLLSGALLYQYAGIPP